MQLYEGEEIRIGDGFPSLVRFFPGDFAKPLVVFFLGWAHLGRISHGFPGCDKKHFLAYWINRRGCPFLGTSYPIDHPIYIQVYPHFSLTNWGKMAAEIVDRFISEKGLRKDVIGISWSAAGQVIRPFNAACRSFGNKSSFPSRFRIYPRPPDPVRPHDRYEKDGKRNGVIKRLSLWFILERNTGAKSLK